MYDVASPSATPYFVVLKWSHFLWRFSVFIQIFTHLHTCKWSAFNDTRTTATPDNGTLTYCMHTVYVSVCVCVYMSKLDTQANMWAIYILYSQVVCTSLVWVVSECVLCCYVSFVLSQCSLYDPTCSHVTFSLRLSLCWIMETLTADKGLNIMEIMALTLPLHRPAELFTYIFLPLNEEVLILFQSVENISAQL